MENKKSCENWPQLLTVKYVTVWIFIRLCDIEETLWWSFSYKKFIIVLKKDTYSNSSNNRTGSNKSIHRCNFGHLLHKIARFWPILAHSCHKINNRTGTIIKRTRVIQIQYLPFFQCLDFIQIQMKMCHLEANLKKLFTLKLPNLSMILNSRKF